MKNKSCKGCYFYGDCPGRTKCAFFTPVDDDAEDAVVESIIHKERNSFREEWDMYVNYADSPEESIRKLSK